MRTKIDKVITRISGSSDYMGDMSRVTGNIETVDREYYTSQLKKLIGIQGVIEKEFKQHDSSELTNLTRLFHNEY